MAFALYPGPMALAQSKHALPQQRQAALVGPPSVASTPIVTGPTVIPTANTIATKEQIDAVDTALPNVDAQLAVVQGNALKQEVDKHSAKFSQTISNAMTNTRQLLELIRESIKNDNVEDLKVVDGLWIELEQLFAAAHDTKFAMPAFLERQRNNMSLYHASLINETIRESQEELNIQHKKVNIQHSLILGHQEAFQDYKTQTAAKLKKVEDLQERLSRLTLEKGNFRTEIDTYKQILEKERSTRAEDLQKVNALQDEFQVLLVAKTQLQAEIDTLRKALSEFQEKTKTIEQEISNRFTAELQTKTDQLMKETQRNTSLNVMIRTLRGDETTARMEANKAKLNNKAISEKYKIQSVEHAKAFTSLNEQTKKVMTLSDDIDRFRNENYGLKQQLSNLSELQKQNTDLGQAKSSLHGQVASLTVELSAANNEGTRAKIELDALLAKIETLDKKIDKLETENNNILSKQSETKKAMQALSVLKDENSKLKSNIDELKATSAISPASGTMNTEERKALEAKIEELRVKKNGLETNLQEWTNLAKRSYKEYKDMLPTYKLADQYRIDSLEKDDIINGLKLELNASKALQPNNMGAMGDAAYWKDKYESVMATIGS